MRAYCPVAVVGGDWGRRESGEGGGKKKEYDAWGPQQVVDMELKT
jgi:hypothetical protein